MADTVVNVLWIPAGLSCDGDSVALTAAMQPSIEEIALGALPGLPGVKFHWPLIEYSLGGAEFLEAFFKAERGELDPFVLVIEGSIANEEIKKEGYWTGFGNAPGTDQPITFSGWIDRLSPEGLGGSRSRNVRDVRRHPRDGRQSDRRDGDPRLSRLGLEIERGRSDRVRSGLPDATRQSFGDDPLPALAGGGTRADDSARRCGTADVAVRNTVHEGCDRAGYYEQGQFATEYDSPQCLVKLGCWGPVVKCNVPKRGWMGGIGGCPNVGGICIGCTMPGFPDKFMPFMDEPPGGKLSSTVSGAVRHDRSERCAATRRRPSTKSRAGATKATKLTTGYTKH